MNLKKMIGRGDTRRNVLCVNTVCVVIMSNV